MSGIQPLIGKDGVRTVMFSGARTIRRKHGMGPVVLALVTVTCRDLQIGLTYFRLHLGADQRTGSRLRSPSWRPASQPTRKRRSPRPACPCSQVINLFIALSSNNGVISSPKLQVGVTLCNQGTCYFANPSTQHGASVHCIHIEQGIDDRCTGYYSSCDSYGPYGAVGSGWATCAEE